MHKLDALVLFVISVAKKTAEEKIHEPSEFESYLLHPTFFISYTSKIDVSLLAFPNAEIRGKRGKPLPMGS